MPESDWSEEVAEAPKSGIPMWVWGCGGCGLIVLILLLVGGGMLFSVVRDAIDPDVVWGNIDEVLPFDDRPTGYQAFGGELSGNGGYMIMSESKGLMAIVFSFEMEDKDRAELDDVFSGGAFNNDNKFGVGNVKEIESMTVTIDGRECQAVRFMTNNEFKIPFAKQLNNSPDVWVLFVDLSRDDGKLRMVELIDLANVQKKSKDSEETEPEKSPEELGQELADRFFGEFTPWN